MDRRAGLLANTFLQEGSSKTEIQTVPDGKALEKDNPEVAGECPEKVSGPATISKFLPTTDFQYVAVTSCLLNRI